MLVNLKEAAFYLTLTKFEKQIENVKIKGEFSST